MSDDLISRQAAIDALHTQFRDGFDGDKWWNSTHVLAVIESLPSSHRWIPVTERLPEKHGEECLVTINDGGIYTTSAQYDVKHKQWYFSYYDKAVGERSRILTDNVTAWMPLPEPWKGDSNATD